MIRWSSSLIGLMFVTAAVALPVDGPRAQSESVVVPSGEARPVTMDDFRPSGLLSSSYNESWTYVFMLGDGMQARFSISQANLGRIIGAVAGAEFAVTNFGGRSFRAPKEYDIENLIWDSDAARLQVHPDIFVEGRLPERHRVRFKSVKHDVAYEVDLTLSDIAPGLTWGDGIFRMGSERVGMFIHIPYARVSGSISIGGTTRQVSGTAYMDHSFQTAFAPRLARSVFRYVHHGERSQVGYFILPSRRYEDRAVGFGGVADGGAFRLSRPAAVEVVSTRPDLGVEVPRQLAIRFEDGRQTILNRRGDQQAYSVLEELTGIQRTVVRRFVGGEALVFRGRGTTNLREPLVYDYVIIR